ncbi:hypothetical protein GpartN1_g3057.t1 [Galdieria partita]|uniref:DUF1279 domain-containing protein n=1 Tax=Galdieria partita TaxID=83374 RepID=A0A9C7PWU4_9RHOD|nr:hypothetical protein GpartN1_g3057.t1 [Galdieria partita]
MMKTWWNAQVVSDTTSQRTWSFGISNRFRHLMATYGVTFIVVSAVMSVCSFLLSLLLVSLGMDVEGLIQTLGNWLETTPIGRPSFLDKLSPQLGSLAIAYLLHRLTSPLRIPLCIALTRYIGQLRTRRQRLLLDNDI